MQRQLLLIKVDPRSGTGKQPARSYHIAVRFNQNGMALTATAAIHRKPAFSEPIPLSEKTSAAGRRPVFPDRQAAKP